MSQLGAEIELGTSNRVLICWHKQVNVWARVHQKSRCTLWLLIFARIELLNIFNSRFLSTHIVFFKLHTIVLNRFLELLLICGLLIKFKHVNWPEGDQVINVAHRGVIQSELALFVIVLPMSWNVMGCESMLIVHLFWAKAEILTLSRRLLLLLRWWIVVALEQYVKLFAFVQIVNRHVDSLWALFLEKLLASTQVGGSVRHQAFKLAARGQATFHWFLQRLDFLVYVSPCDLEWDSEALSCTLDHM